MYNREVSSKQLLKGFKMESNYHEDWQQFEAEREHYELEARLEAEDEILQERYDDVCEYEQDYYDDYPEYYDDGQPSMYEEYQDLYGGDDWDHGQYDYDEWN